MKKVVLGLFVSSITCMLSSCRTNHSEPETTGYNVSTQAESDSLIPTLEEASPSFKEPDTIREEKPNLTNRIIWTLPVLPQVSEETREKINDFVKEKGLDCHIDFVVPPMGTQYVGWLDEQKESGRAPDILTSSYWEHGQLDVPLFVETQFMPLNDFLSSAEGTSLYDMYSSVEWEQAAINGMVYSVPCRLVNNSGEVYLYINDRFAEIYDTVFDGTYDSLRRAYAAASEPDSVIACESFNTSIIHALMGMHNIFFFSYDMKTNNVPVLTNLDTTREFFENFYSDFREGVLINDVSLDSVPDNAFCYICKNRAAELEGFSERLLCTSAFRSDPSGVGVSKDSDNKSLALLVLSVCYSDPGIASLLCWGEEDPSGWEDMTSYLNTCEVSPITGFIPELTEEEHEILEKYNNDFGSLINNLYVDRGNASVINPDYLDYLNRFFISPRNYGNIFEIINEQLVAWKAKEK